MFKKPKRNFRSRRRDSQSDDDSTEQFNIAQVISTEDEPPDNETPEIKAVKKKKKDKEKANKTSVLSFDHGEEEVAEFKIKKSSHSKKIAKQLKKELQKEKEERDREEQEKEESPEYSAENMKAMLDAQRAENGAVKDLEASQSPNEEDDPASSKFSSANMDFLGMGEIPDAATIHAIRKKRQMAREQGDFIPIEDTVKYDKGKSRLVRDDDNDKSDDEQLEMTVNQRDKELRMMQQTIIQAHEEDESGSEHDWEEQQIRKGVQAASNQAGEESFPPPAPAPASYYGYNGNGALGYDNQVTDMEVEDQSSRRVPPTSLPQVSMEAIIKKMKERLSEATSVHRAHLAERDDLASRLADTRISLASASSAQAHNQYRFFQEMRGYVTDLVECLNHKVPAIDYLERGMFKQYQKHADKFIKRRQEDIKDESTDCMKVKTSAVAEAASQDPEKQRRVAEREARRTRRRRRREMLNIEQHEEGMSTDDELTSSEAASLAAERERVSGEAERLFIDVVEDFWQLSSIMSRFERWKQEQQQSYEEAYIGLCLPKLFGPLIRLRLVQWNPLKASCRDFEENSWYESLMFYGHREGRPPSPDDADLKLMPSIIEKVLLPKLTGFVESVWDPLSAQQTTRLVTLSKRLLRDYPTLTADSKNTKTFVKAVVERMRRTLDDDVFMPLYPKAILESNKAAAAFFHRQFWQCVKLLGNMLAWEGVLAERPLQELALEALLNRYLLLGLTNSPHAAHALYACQVVVSTVPRGWWPGAAAPPPPLAPLCRYLATLSAQLAAELDKKEARERQKSVCRLLVSLHDVDTAMAIAAKHSFKLHQL